MAQNRSSEELAMRAIVVPELRRRWPDARIIHELSVRYSTNRIDLAAVTPDEIISVELKSSRDVCDRLEKQLRAFLPISSRVIVALAPKWNADLPMLKTDRGNGITAYTRQFTEAQGIINSVGGHTETWTVDADAGTLNVTQKCYHANKPWPAKMLDVLHVSELIEIAASYGCGTGKRPVHAALVSSCADMMTGREIARSVCAALRVRNAFAAESDPPIKN